MLSGRLPYGRGFATAKDAQRLDYVSISQIREDVPVWFDAALEKAVHKAPAKRTDALSALTEDLRRPNTALGYDRPRPLLERNPAGFWRGVSIALAIVVFGLLLLLRHR